MKKLLLLLITLSFAVTHAQPTPANPGWTPASMMAYKRVSSPALSPDGQRVVYVVATARMDAENSDFLSQIWVASADGKTNYQFTYGDKSATDPQFSPDGQWLAFLSGRGKDGKRQIYRMRTTGGEAEPVTAAKNSVATFAWSPDSRRMAYTVTDPRADEKERREKKDWDVVDEFQNAHLYVVTLSKAANATSFPTKQVTKGDFHIVGMDWSPDSRTLVFAQQKTPSANAWTTSKIALVSADSGAVQPLVTDKGATANPVFSPDGKFIAYVSDAGDGSWMRKVGVYVMSVAGGPIKKLADTPDENPSILGWSPDGKTVVVSEARRTSSGAYALPADGSALRSLANLSKGVMAGATLNHRGDVAYIYQNTDLPTDVYVASLTNPVGRKLTDLHADYIAARPAPAKTEVITWKSKDGKYDIEGLLTYPANYQPGRKYPLVLNVHGGPAGVFVQSYTGASGPYPIQALAQRGYAVLRPNPRGSGGYGAAFRRANYRDWGGNDYDDLMAGVDKTIALGVAHPDSLVETGWSYGGYMTSTIITKTNRFKAVMAGAPVTNLMSFNGTADIADFLPSYFGGEFWDEPQAYADHSPMFHVKNAKTPTLIIHGMADDRVPPEQGFQLHRALQRLGVKTQMVTYPRQPHGFTEPKFIQDVGERVIRWFDTHLGRVPATPAPVLTEKR